MTKLDHKLDQFDAGAKIGRSKGKLGMVLVVTRHAREHGLPLNPVDLKAASGTQVKGLGMSSVQKVLGDHGISQVLAKEGGRTSRGMISSMEKYVDFLNANVAQKELQSVEDYWIARVRDFFAAKPFSLKMDDILSVRAVIQNLLAQAQDAQKSTGGTMIVGTLMQHMVGAKLDLMMGGAVKHHGSNEADEGTGRHGDFDVGDVSIHVTATASEALIHKCEENLAAGRRPIIVTTAKNRGVAETQAETFGIADRVDVLDFQQFIATNILEWSRFDRQQRRLKLGELGSKPIKFVRRRCGTGWRSTLNF
jgi:hypothetical protein